MTLCSLPLGGKSRLERGETMTESLKQHSTWRMAHSNAKNYKAQGKRCKAQKEVFLCALCVSVVKFGLLVSVIAFILPMKSFSAETVKLRYVQSIYFDDKGGSIKQPEGVACNDKSVLIVGDTGNGRLLRYTFQDKSIAAGNEIKIPQLSYPIRVQMNSKGEIFGLDGKQRRIVRLTPKGEFKDYLSPEGLPSPSSFVPRSFKIDPNDHVYMLDIFSERVLVIAPDGKYQKHIAFPKSYGFFSDLAVDPKGRIFLIDSIRKTVFAAQKDSKEFAPLTGSLKEYLSFPTYITTDHRGRIFVVDENGSGIVILGQDGSFQGRQLSMGWNEGLLSFPSQICINDKEEVFIADRGNSRVQVFTVVK
jgi:hypothetical protein